MLKMLLIGLLENMCCIGESVSVMSSFLMVQQHSRCKYGVNISKTNKLTPLHWRQRLQTCETS